MKEYKISWRLEGTWSVKAPSRKEALQRFHELDHEQLFRYAYRRYSAEYTEHPDDLVWDFRRSCYNALAVVGIGVIIIMVVASQVWQIADIGKTMWHMRALSDWYGFIILIGGALVVYGLWKLMMWWPPSRPGQN